MTVGAGADVIGTHLPALDAPKTDPRIELRVALPGRRGTWIALPHQGDHVWEGTAPTRQLAP